MSTRIQIAKKICRSKMSDDDRDILMQKLYGDWDDCEQDDDDNFHLLEGDTIDVYRTEYSTSSDGLMDSFSMSVIGIEHALDKAIANNPNLVQLTYESLRKRAEQNNYQHPCPITTAALNAMFKLKDDEDVKQMLNESLERDLKALKEFENEVKTGKFTYKPQTIL